MDVYTGGGMRGMREGGATTVGRYASDYQPESDALETDKEEELTRA